MNVGIFKRLNSLMNKLSLLLPLMLFLIVGCDSNDKVSVSEQSIHFQCFDKEYRLFQKKNNIESKDPVTTIHINGSKIQVSAKGHKPSDITFSVSDEKIDISYKSLNESRNDGSYMDIKLKGDRYTGIMKVEWMNYWSEKNTNQFKSEGPILIQLECEQLRQKKF